MSDEMVTKTKACVERCYPGAKVECQPAQLVATESYCVTRLLTVDGRVVEVRGELPRDVEYDVEVTVTPRRWAPDGYEWEGDVLAYAYSDGSSFRFNLCKSFIKQEPAVEARYQGNLVLLPVPADVYRAFEKAGLI